MKTKLLCFILAFCACLPLIAQPKPMEKIGKDGIYLVAEKMPEFPGGGQELMKYLSTNIKYPLKAQQQAITGRVIVQFVVMEDGSLSMEQIVRGVDPSLDEEALRVVKLMPKWIPGTENGTPVKVRFTVPISFSLTGSKAERQQPGFTVPMGQPLLNNKIEGVWQSCSVQQNGNEYRVILRPTVKVLAADHSFVNLFVAGNETQPVIVTAEGTYKKKSNNRYEESLEKSSISTFKKGSKNDITYEFLNDNLVRFSFVVPGIEELWIEYWFRSPMR